MATDAAESPSLGSLATGRFIRVRRRSGAAGVGVRGSVEILAFRSELIHQAFELSHAALGGADGHAILAARVAARLTGIQPVLQCPGQQAVSDVPQVRVL